jgi:4-diphosphocytidyl-2-C-methyl-D-erythritol kinase
MLVVPAYAKVNLALEVTGRRPDGWHDVASVITTIDWHDLVGVAAATTPPRKVALRVTGPFAEGVPTDQANLAARAATMLLRLAGDPPLALHLWLHKDVPSAAADLTTTAADLGSDVPALLAGGTLLARGRGELLSPLPAPEGGLHLAVAVAGPSTTAAAYHALHEDERQPTGRASRLADALCQRAPLDPSLLGSALEAPACRAAPGLSEALDRLRALTPADSWHLTGSGGAAFALATNPAHAAALADKAAAAGFAARACRTVAPRLGPMHHTSTAP